MLHESANIRVELDDQIATLWLDHRDEPGNPLTFAVLDELESALQAIESTPSIDLLVLRSGQAVGFSRGFDLDEIAGLPARADRAAFAARGQQIIQKLTQAVPDGLTIAVIEGECRSGGLELALSCDYRVAVARPDTVFGFPEVERGLMPCWGGTWRLPRLVGFRPALDLLLNGQEWTANQSLKLGLVDRLFDQSSARIELQAFLDQLQDSPRRLALPRRFGQRLRDNFTLGRWFTLKQANRWLIDTIDKERPAGRAILKAAWMGLSSGPEALAAERSLFVELSETDVFRHAVEREDRARMPARVYPEPINPIAAVPERVGIVGAGELGAPLACWLTLRGRQVVVQESSDETLRLASDRIDQGFAAICSRGAISPNEAEKAKKNIRKTTNWNGFDSAGLVIEAIDEDLGMKRGLFHELEQHVRPRAILATTSSTLRVEAIQAELERPGRVAGLHFLDAALGNPLVEVARSPLTDSGTLAALDQWFRGWGKTPVFVSDRPGRLVYRVQLAYLSEAVQLVSEGLPPDLIDRDMRRFGMRTGPLQWIDTFGFDDTARLVENLQIARGDGFVGNLLLDRFRNFGLNGRENGEGFYRYRRDRASTNHLARMISWNDASEDVICHYVFDPQEALDDGVERMVLRAINEAAACLPDEPDADPGLVDMALTLGAGWAPHRGGPLRYADEMGLPTIVERLTEFTERFGKRFEPCVELQRRAEAGEAFYENLTPDEQPRLWRMAG